MPIIFAEQVYKLPMNQISLLKKVLSAVRNLGCWALISEQIFAASLMNAHNTQHRHRMPAQ